MHCTQVLSPSEHFFRQDGAHLTNKQRQRIKKAEKKLEKEERKRSSNQEQQQSNGHQQQQQHQTPIVADLQSLSI